MSLTPEPASTGPSTTGATRPARRELAVVVLACVAAAALALFAASRTWLVEVTVRAEPLPALSTARSGGSLVPALPALALVALAGAGGLLATRGVARSLVGVLLMLAGIGMLAALLANWSGGVARAWVLVSMMAGLVVVAAGAATVLRGRSWPAMGSRYDRAQGAGTARPGVPGADGPDGGSPGYERVSDTDRTDESGASLWDAIDRGEDPTSQDKSEVSGLG